LAWRTAPDVVCHLGTPGGQVSRVCRPCRGGARRAQDGQLTRVGACVPGCAGVVLGLLGACGCGGGFLVPTSWWSRCAVRDACTRARVLDLTRVPGCLGCAGARGIVASSRVASSRVRMSGVCPVPGGGMSDPFRCVLDPSCIRRGFACRGVGRGGPGLPGTPAPCTGNGDHLAPGGGTCAGGWNARGLGCGPGAPGVPRGHADWGWVAKKCH